MANKLFFAEKMQVIFEAKVTNVFENTLATTVNEFVINELVKLICFEQLGLGVITIQALRHFIADTKTHKQQENYFCLGG